jgi:hypothetical protein
MADIFGSLQNAGSGILGALGNAMQDMTIAQNPQLYAIKQQQQQQQNTYQALVPLIQQAYPSLPQQHQDALARAATLDPEIRKQITPNFNVRPELLETGTDPLTGQKTYSEKNFQSGHYSLAPVGQTQQGGQAGVPGAGPGDAGLSMQTFKDAVNNGVKGEDLYQHMPTGARDFVRSLVENRAQVSPMMLRNPQMLPYFQAANIIDPTFDQSTYHARQAAMTSWKSGKDAEAQKASNLAATHLADVLLPAMKALDNLPVPALNMLANPIEEHVLGLPAQKNFRIAAHAAAEEVSKVYKINNLSDTEIRAWESNLSENMSPSQMKGAVGTLVQLYKGGLQAMHDKRINGIGPMADSKLGPMITPTGQAGIDKLEKFVGGGDQAPPQGNALPGGWKVQVRP